MGRAIARGTSRIWRSAARSDCRRRAAACRLQKAAHREGWSIERPGDPTLRRVARSGYTAGCGGDVGCNHQCDGPSHQLSGVRDASVRIDAPADRRTACLSPNSRCRVCEASSNLIINAIFVQYIVAKSIAQTGYPAPLLARLARTSATVPSSVARSNGLATGPGSRPGPAGRRCTAARTAPRRSLSSVFVVWRASLASARRRPHDRARAVCIAEAAVTHEVAQHREVAGRDPRRDALTRPR